MRPAGFPWACRLQVGSTLAEGYGAKIKPNQGKSNQIRPKNFLISIPLPADVIAIRGLIAP
jgi:hypothetical protein